MTLNTILIRVVLPLCACLMKWFVVRFIAVEHVRRLCLRQLGFEPVPFESDKQVRLLGWDFANVSVGLFIAAMIVEDSRFSRFQAAAGQLNNLVTIVCFVVFIFFYALAIIVRYIFVETAEKQKDYLGSRTFQLLPGLLLDYSPQWLCAFWSWLLGLLLMFFASWLAVGVK